MGLKAYLLIRIGMDVNEGQWFGRRLGPRPWGEGMEGQADMPEWTVQSAGNPKDSRPVFHSAPAQLATYQALTKANTSRRP